MKNKLSRRSFLKAGAALGGALVAGRMGPGGRFVGPAYASAAELAVSSARGPFENAVRAVEALGGMGRFVSRGARVGLLINAPFANPGAHVHPDAALAVAVMAFEAGAGSVCCLKSPSSGYWRRAAGLKTHADAVDRLEDCESDFGDVPIPKGRVLKEAYLNRGLLEVDRFFNLAVVKDHSGTRFSGVLKNMMGSTTYRTNRFFHDGPDRSGGGEDVGHLSQCIADLNLVRRPDFCLADATVVLTENGPYGPGRLLRPDKVAAGVDPRGPGRLGSGDIGP